MMLHHILYMSTMYRYIKDNYMNTLDKFQQDYRNNLSHIYIFLLAHHMPDILMYCKLNIRYRSSKFGMNNGILHIQDFLVFHNTREYICTYLREGI